MKIQSTFVIYLLFYGTQKETFFEDSSCSSNHKLQNIIIFLKKYVILWLYAISSLL